ncbi:serine rich and transmembrane domain containing 1 [Syngnathoides biaculeatus]|uniref:serine rich and transmembrane domain containing 1 n=1 Tax=Syngnathoides biaculeatus TaxID=300417 RepID=UPI002ADDBD3C|nr:serine rich and transmembrane domain containing 1 [Syngnathoides biaculeatus]
MDRTGISLEENGTFLRFSPTSVSGPAASAGEAGIVYVYVWLLLGLLVLLLSLLVIALHRLKNVISSSTSSSSSSGEAGGSFANVEIRSISSSPKSTLSSLCA